MSFIPLDGGDCSQDALESLEYIPARKVAVSEILPLTLVGNQVSLGISPTNCALPLSPIFIKAPGSEKVELFNNTTSALLDNLDEIVSLPQEFLNLGKKFKVNPKLASGWKILF